MPDFRSIPDFAYRSLKGPVADNMVVNTITLFGHYYAGKNYILQK